MIFFCCFISNAAIMFCNQVIHHKRLPFDVKKDRPKPVKKSVCRNPEGLRYMMYDVLISDQAGHDLGEILLRISLSPGNAVAQLKRPEAAVQTLY